MLNLSGYDTTMTSNDFFFSRDLSWLSFNGRVLEEASRNYVPLLERIKFLAIYSANLDEFYRVRMPVLMALKKIKKQEDISDLPQLEKGVYKQAKQLIQRQQERFGEILQQDIIQRFREYHVWLIYKEPIPDVVLPQTADYFFSTIAAYLEITYLNKDSNFFPGNNQLYLAITFDDSDERNTALIHIPSDAISRFYSTFSDGITYVLFIDDIIKQYTNYLFPGRNITGVYTFKITRDAELDLQDEYEGDIAEKIEAQISRRDFGLATRMLYQPDIPPALLGSLTETLQLRKANHIAGGYYHNLKDFMGFPVQRETWQYQDRTPLPLHFSQPSLFAEITRHDLLINAPYESYDTILRFFNEAAIADDVYEIYTTMYRVANDSRIIHALITAAKNGKSVTVFVELKARFDEANNIKWAKRMKAAGVTIIYSIPNLKVHAKVALVRKTQGDETVYLGLLSTGNLNENTARFYTDHILLTANQEILQELHALFSFLSKRKTREPGDDITFDHLAVAHFNLAGIFTALIDQEIANTHSGLPAGITIKLNNLEEEQLINKLYEASQAGIKVNLIVRGICRLRPGIPGLSDHITVKRIVDRYLEHGRIFIFHNGGSEKIYLGSADWMNRNIYRRIEVCFPLYSDPLRKMIKEIVNLQLQDDASAVLLDKDLNNIPLQNISGIHSQEAIYQYLKNRKK